MPKADEKAVVPAPAGKGTISSYGAGISSSCRSSFAGEKAVVPAPPAKARLVPEEPRFPPPAAPAEGGFIDSNLLGGGTLIISPVTNRRVKLRDSIRNPVTRVVLLDFHNTIDRYFVPDQRRPYTIPYRSKQSTYAAAGDYFLDQANCHCSGRESGWPYLHRAVLSHQQFSGERVLVA